MKKGLCKLCRKEKMLSFEHVPPRSAYNKHTTYKEVPLADYFTSDKTFNGFKGKMKQGGIGYNSLCRECNTFMGNQYVAAYQQWVHAGFELLIKSKSRVTSFSVKEQQPLKVLKQIIGMFLSINEDWFGESHPELVDFVKDPQSNTLPEKFRVFAYSNIEGVTRYLNYQCAYYPSLGVVACSELAYPPFGYVLTIDYDGEIPRLTEITSFKTRPINEVITIDMSLEKLPTHFPITLDYRRMEEIIPSKGDY